MSWNCQGAMSCCRYNITRLELESLTAQGQNTFIALKLKTEKLSEEIEKLKQKITELETIIDDNHSRRFEI